MVSMLTLLIAPLLIGLLAGWLRGGRPARLAQLRLRAPWLAWLAVAVQVAQLVPAIRRVIEDGLGVPVLVPVYALLGLWLLMNLPGRRIAVQAAIMVLFLGGLMNGVVIAANGRMPFSITAAHQADVPEAKISAVGLPKNEPTTARTRLAWLGDSLPVRPLHEVISPGDLIIVVGIALLAATATSARHRRHTSPPSPAAELEHD
jgi:hypothetical protein